ncbi:MAG: hypothetical protein EBV69_09910 [Oxalobacteraceae bacterium]|nr:hypothetical protein [Oxalobacteraceae bacterium]
MHNWNQTNEEIELCCLPCYLQISLAFRQELGDVPKGGLWISEAKSKNQLDDLLKTDPFYIAGLRQSYEILHWSKANEERKVLI